MTIAFSIGQFVVTFAATPADVKACQELRHQHFFGCAGVDADEFDPVCRHIMVHCDGDLVATARTSLFASGAEVKMSYSAQRYDLKSFFSFQSPMLEVGRLCAADVPFRVEAMRACWGALAQIVDQAGVAVLFGCSSFEGIDPKSYKDAFAFLSDKHRAPSDLMPLKRSAETFDLPSDQPFDKKRAIAQLPPLLRTYLSLGGWVSDHAVVDRDMNTLHVFTALEIAAIPEARARALRAMV